MPFNKDDIKPEEWAEAKDFFDKNPDAVKYRKKHTAGGKERGHSFVYINNQLYALNNTKKSEPDAGVGAFGRAKIGVNERGERIVVKVEGFEAKYRTYDYDPKTELKVPELEGAELVMQQSGYLLDRKIIKLDNGVIGKIRVKDNITVTAETKLMTAFEYRGDRNLEMEFKKNIEAKKPPKNLIIALKIMMEIESLHQLRIIHKDIKPENFALNGTGPELKIKAIDFDMSTFLPRNQDFVTGVDVEGTPGYIAPEIDKNKTYSFSSDVYALGKTLQDLDLPEEFYKEMMVTDPVNRTSLSFAMGLVCKKLEEHQEQEPDNTEVSSVLKEYMRFNTPSSSVRLIKIIENMIHKDSRVEVETKNLFFKTMPGYISDFYKILSDPGLNVQEKQDRLKAFFNENGMNLDLSNPETELNLPSGEILKNDERLQVMLYFKSYLYSNSDILTGDPTDYKASKESIEDRLSETRFYKDLKRGNVSTYLETPNSLMEKLIPINEDRIKENNKAIKELLVKEKDRLEFRTNRFLGKDDRIRRLRLIEDTLKKLEKLEGSEPSDGNNEKLKKILSTLEELLPPKDLIQKAKEAIFGKSITLKNISPVAREMSEETLNVSRLNDEVEKLRGSLGARKKISEHLKKLPAKSFGVEPGDVIGGLVYVMDKPLGIEEGMVGISIASEPYRNFIRNQIEVLEQEIHKNPDFKSEFRSLLESVEGDNEKPFYKDKIDLLMNNKEMGRFLFKEYKKSCGVEKGDKFHVEIKKLMNGEDKAYMVKQDGELILGATGPSMKRIAKTTTGKALVKSGIGALVIPFWKAHYLKENDPVKVNADAIIETIATKIASIKGFPSQEIDTIEGTYENGATKIATVVTWTPGCQDLSGHLMGGGKNTNIAVSLSNDHPIKVNQSGQLMEVTEKDAKGKAIKFSKIETDTEGKITKVSIDESEYNKGLAVSDDSIYGLGESLITLISLGDRDAIGSKGQNKAIVPLDPPQPGTNYKHQFFGIDFGKAYQSENPLLNSLSDDFSFEGEKFKNYSMLYDNPLSDKMKGVYLLAALYGELPHKAAIVAEYEKTDPVFSEKLKAYPTPKPGEKANIKLMEERITFFKAEAEKYGEQGDTKKQKEFEGYAEKIEKVKEIAEASDNKILEKFKNRLALLPSQLDFVSNMEKLTAKKAHSLSPDGKVLLNHIQVNREDRIAWQLEKNPNDPDKYILSCEELDPKVLKDVLKKINNFYVDKSESNPIKFNLNDDKKIELTLTEAELQTLMKEFTEEKIRAHRTDKKYHCRTQEDRDVFHKKLEASNPDKKKAIFNALFEPPSSESEIKQAKLRGDLTKGKAAEQLSTPPSVVKVVEKGQVTTSHPLSPSQTYIPFAQAKRKNTSPTPFLTADSTKTSENKTEPTNTPIKRPGTN